MQVGFFEIVAMPLFNAYVSLIPDAHPMLDNATNNYHEWHQMAATTSTA